MSKRRRPRQRSRGPTRRKPSRWRPDKNPGNKEEAETRFKTVGKAFECLMFPGGRRAVRPGRPGPCVGRADHCPRLGVRPSRGWRCGLGATLRRGSAGGCSGVGQRLSALLGGGKPMSKVTPMSSVQCEVMGRLGQARSAFQAMKRSLFGNRRLAISTRLRLYKSLVVSRLDYGICTFDMGTRAATDIGEG